MSIKDKLEAADYVCSNCPMSLTLACAIFTNNKIMLVHTTEDRFGSCKHLRERVQNIEDKLERDYSDQD